VTTIDMHPDRAMASGVTVKLTNTGKVLSAWSFRTAGSASPTEVTIWRGIRSLFKYLEAEERAGT
jgi:hypothetical protein